MDCDGEITASNGEIITDKKPIHRLPMQAGKKGMVMGESQHKKQKKVNSERVSGSDVSKEMENEKFFVENF